MASPSEAFKYHNYPVNGVGLVRQEFIFNNFIKVHPMALLKHKNLNDSELTTQVVIKLDEAINLLFFNNLINIEDDFYTLTDKSKFHIQSLESIKIAGFSGDVEFIMDFLP